MSKSKTFEDLQAWKDSRKLVRIIYKLSSVGDLSRDFALRNQMRRAALSVMANIAEGFERTGNREFLQFLSIAKGSAGELRSHLHAAYDSGFIQQEDYQHLSHSVLEVSRQLAGLMKFLKGSPYKGSKFEEMQT